LYEHIKAVAYIRGHAAGLATLQSRRKAIDLSEGRGRFAANMAGHRFSGKYPTPRCLPFCQEGLAVVGGIEVGVPFV
jgi:hypothetical protein